MKYAFENIVHDEIVPFKIFFQNVRSCTSHWHKELEILFVLKGSVIIQVEGAQILLNEGSLFLINSGDIHLTHETDEENILVAFQFDPEAAKLYDSDFHERRFSCNSQQLLEKEQADKYKILKHLIANIMFTMREKKLGYGFNAASNLNLLLMSLVQNFEVKDIRKGIRQSRIDETPNIFRVYQELFGLLIEIIKRRSPFRNLQRWKI